MVRALRVRRSRPGRSLGEHIDLFLAQMIGWLLLIDDFDADHQTQASYIAGAIAQALQLAESCACCSRSTKPENGQWGLLAKSCDRKRFEGASGGLVSFNGCEPHQ